MSSCDLSFELSIQQEFDVILNHFKEIDIAGKETIKIKLREITYSNMTSMCVIENKVKLRNPKKVDQINW